MNCMWVVFITEELPLCRGEEVDSTSVLHFHCQGGVRGSGVNAYALHVHSGTAGLLQVGGE
jgi:hypothetical protein